MDFLVFEIYKFFAGLRKMLWEVWDDWERNGEVDTDR